MRIVMLSIFLWMSINVIGQSAVATSACQNPSFDKEVDSYLSCSVDTIAVSKLSKSLGDFVVLDARERAEYEVSHIPSAEHIGYDHFKVKNVAHIDKETPIVVYCSIGYRSEKVGELLKKSGFKNVKNLYGSIFEWANQGHALVNKYNMKTKKIHTYNKKWSKWMTNTNYKKVW